MVTVRGGLRCEGKQRKCNTFAANQSRATHQCNTRLYPPTALQCRALCCRYAVGDASGIAGAVLLYGNQRMIWREDDDPTMLESAIGVAILIAFTFGAVAFLY